MKEKQGQLGVRLSVCTFVHADRECKYVWVLPPLVCMLAASPDAKRKKEGKWAKNTSQGSVKNSKASRTKGNGIKAIKIWRGGNDFNTGSCFSKVVET